MTETLDLELPDSAATEALGAQLANLLPHRGVVYLSGDLGAGKTTLVRGLLHALGHSGNVKSPTYTLVEPYFFADRHVLHCDLYRLADPEELSYLDLRDAVDNALLLIEWPERGAGWLPPAILEIRLSYCGSGRHCRLIIKNQGLHDIARLSQNSNGKGRMT